MSFQLSSWTVALRLKIVTGLIIPKHQIFGKLQIEAFYRMVHILITQLDQVSV